MKTETSKKKYDSRHRLTWAARYPLKPGRDVASRRCLLLLIADTAITGEYWMSQEKLAERLGLTARSARRKLVKLCAEGALRAHPRGFKQTTIYTLMRLGEVEKYGDFLPLEATRTALADRTSTSSQQPPPPFDRTSTSSRDRTSTSSQNGLTGHQRPPKEAIREEHIREEAEAAAAETPTSADSVTASARPAAAAAALNSSTIPKDQTAARHACPNCERTWPKHFGPICFNCDTPQQRRADRNRKVLGFTEQTFEERVAELDAEEAAEKEAAPAPAPPAPLPPPAPPAPPSGSKTTRRLRAAGYGAAWLNHQGLDQLIGNRDLKEVCELMRAIGSRLPPEPEEFFEDYDRHLEDHKQAEAAYLAPFPSPANGTSGGLIPIGEALANLPGVQSRMAA